MSAPAGNKHAEKWTLEKTIEELKQLEITSACDEIIFLGQLLMLTGHYNDIWAYWRRKWGHEEDVADLMGRIMQVFEVRIFLKSAKKEIHAGTAMFALKCHYGWVPARPAKETPAPAEPEPTPPAQIPTHIVEPAPKERKPLIVKHFTDISHLVPVRPYCGLPTYTEPGETGFWVRSGKDEYYKMERETYP